MVSSTVGAVEEQQCCANCGKKASRALNEWWMAFGETYQGDEKVVSTERQPTYEEYQAGHVPPCFQDTREEWERRQRAPFRRWKVRTWDGKSYKKLAYGRFCTLRCAWAFAEYVLESREAEGSQDDRRRNGL